MKSALFAIIAIVILAAGGGAAYMYFQKPAVASVGEDKEHMAAQEDDHDPKKSAKHEFVELSPLILPIIDQNGVSQVVNIVVVVEVKNSTRADKVRTMEPRLKDAYIQALYGVLHRRAALNEGVLRVDMVKDRLYNISHQVMGEDVVEDVLLQVVQQRPI